MFIDSIPTSSNNSHCRTEYRCIMKLWTVQFDKQRKGNIGSWGGSYDDTILPLWHTECTIMWTCSGNYDNTNIFPLCYKEYIHVEHVQETTNLQIMIRIQRMYTHVNMLILPLHNIECTLTWTCICSPSHYTTQNVHLCTSSRNCSDTYQYMYWGTAKMFLYGILKNPNLSLLHWQLIHCLPHTLKYQKD